MPRHRVLRPLLSVLGFVSGVVALWAITAILSSGSASAEPLAAGGYGLGKTVSIGGAAAAAPKKDISDSPKKKESSGGPPPAVVVKAKAPVKVTPVAAPIAAPVVPPAPAPIAPAPIAVPIAAPAPPVVVKAAARKTAVKKAAVKKAAVTKSAVKNTVARPVTQPVAIPAVHTTATVKKAVKKPAVVKKPVVAKKVKRTVGKPSTGPVVRPASLTEQSGKPEKSSFVGDVQDNIKEKLKNPTAVAIQSGLETAGDAAAAGGTARKAAAAKRRAHVKAVGAATPPGQTYRGTANPRPVGSGTTYRGQPHTDLGRQVTASRGAGLASRSTARWVRAARGAARVPVVGTVLTGVGVGLDVRNGAPVDRAVVSGAAGLGSAVVVGGYVGGVVGTFIPVPVVGTIAGAAVGTAVGIGVSAAVDAAYDPVKGWVTDGAGAVGDAAQSVGGTIVDGAESVGGFLNPFD
jgi:hypothetical protein